MPARPETETKIYHLTKSHAHVAICFLLLLVYKSALAGTETRHLVFYDRGTGSGAVGYINEDGKYVEVGATSKKLINATHLISSHNNVLWYRSSDGLACTIKLVGAIGRAWDTSDCKIPLGAGWTHVVSTAHNIVFYNSNSGLCKVGAFDEYGFFKWQRDVDIFPDAAGYSHVASTRSGVFFYDRGTGKHAVLKFDPDGVYEQTFLSSGSSQMAGYEEVLSSNDKSWIILSGRDSSSFEGFIDGAGGFSGQIAPSTAWGRGQPKIVLGQWIVVKATNSRNFRGLNFNATAEVCEVSPKGHIEVIKISGNHLGNTNLVSVGEHILSYENMTGNWSVEHLVATKKTYLGFAWTIDMNFARTQLGVNSFRPTWTNIIAVE